MPANIYPKEMLPESPINILEGGKLNNRKGNKDKHKAKRTSIILLSDIPFIKRMTKAEKLKKIPPDAAIPSVPSMKL